MPTDARDAGLAEIDTACNRLFAHRSTSERLNDLILRARPLKTRLDILREELIVANLRLGAPGQEIPPGPADLPGPVSPRR